MLEVIGEGPLVVGVEVLDYTGFCCCILGSFGVCHLAQVFLEMLLFCAVLQKGENALGMAAEEKRRRGWENQLEQTEPTEPTEPTERYINNFCGSSAILATITPSEPATRLGWSTF